MEINSNETAKNAIAHAAMGKSGGFSDTYQIGFIAGMYCAIAMSTLYSEWAAQVALYLLQDKELDTIKAGCRHFVERCPVVSETRGVEPRTQAPS